MDVNLMDLSNKTIIVTGASSGIGRASCILFSCLGARVIMIARSEDKLKRTQEMLEGEGHIIYPLDLSDINTIQTSICNIARQYGPLYGLVHCAGVQITRSFRNTSIADYLNMFNIHCLSFIEMAKGFSKKGNYEKDGASIIAISSVMSMINKPGLSAYSASKSALNSAIKTLALELADRKIRVNSISPAWVKTELFENYSKFLSEKQIQDIISEHPLDMGEPEDVANAAAFLLSKAGKWTTGSNLIIDGGYSIKK
ncbi:SDR family oxidoreductase [Petroclostridium sp. X23]|uniref:SDR family NAD(P)-dependent oxidoreductase n=1 Tax=Petroclostridium sp. X23 TaxID=3045146 RepID=UPI0024AE59E5|nr:SDR family oxidoreductase [Petroclostridium sp. X23]WHH58342.1 SDR family oxidoreductase [Petroclostridium sp. X23]